MTVLLSFEEKQMTARNWDTVRLIKVSFKVNKGSKFGDFRYCRLNRGCPLNTGFSEVSLYFESVDEIRKLVEVCIFK